MNPYRPLWTWMTWYGMDLMGKILQSKDRYEVVWYPQGIRVYRGERYVVIPDQGLGVTNYYGTSANVWFPALAPPPDHTQTLIIWGWLRNKL